MHLKCIWMSRDLEKGTRTVHGNSNTDTDKTKVRGSFHFNSLYLEL